MQKFIKPLDEDNMKCICLKCKDFKNNPQGKQLLVNSVYLHIKSEKHRENTPQTELKKLDKLIEEINSWSETKKKKQHKPKENNKDDENYLNFIGFLMSLNLSYAQIQNVGGYLKNLAKKNCLGFLKKFCFEEKLISSLSKNCFRPHLLEQIKEKLKKTPYSLIIDNATFSNQNFCALKVKFLEKEYNEELNMEMIMIENRIITLSTLKKALLVQPLKILSIENYLLDKISKIILKV